MVSHPEHMVSYPEHMVNHPEHMVNHPEHMVTHPSYMASHLPQQDTNATSASQVPHQPCGFYALAASQPSAEVQQPGVISDPGFTPNEGPDYLTPASAMQASQQHAQPHAAQSSLAAVQEYISMA
jgi:hypothetical protein